MTRRINSKTVTPRQLIIVRMDKLTNDFIFSAQHLKDTKRNWPVFDSAHVMVCQDAGGMKKLVVALRGGNFYAPERAAVEDAILGHQGHAKLTIENNYTTGVLTIPAEYLSSVFAALGSGGYYIECTERGPVTRPFITEGMQNIIEGHVKALAPYARNRKAKRDGASMALRA